MTMSASAPGAMTPLRGYSPNIRAGVVAHASTQRAREISPATHTLVQQVDAVLHPGHAVGDLGEVAAAQFLLVLETERAVVGRDDRQIVGAQPTPQIRLVVLLAERGRGDVLGALEVGRGQVLDGQ